MVLYATTTVEVPVDQWCGGEIPAVLEASFFDKGGQVRLHSSQGNEDFDVVMPVLHNGAYRIPAGRRYRGRRGWPRCEAPALHRIVDQRVDCGARTSVELERVRQATRELGFAGPPIHAGASGLAP